MSDIDKAALDSLSVAPDDAQGGRLDGQHDAGRDKSIAKRLAKDPESNDARLDNALDESMDASDPPASTPPAHNQAPAASSGYDEEAERKLREEKK